MSPARVFGLMAVLLLAARLCHSDIVWVEEAYPAAAAREVLQGKTLYRDIWFDKPPLYALIYLLWGAQTGVPLRVAGALYVLLCGALLYRFGRDVWGEREGLTAAALLAFFLTFGIPAAVMALAPDLLLVAPHIAAVHAAWRGPAARQATLAGLAAGVGLLFNSKAVFVLAACALWQWRALHWLLLGFAIPNAILAAVLALQGALGAYWEQVWAWGFLYSGHTFVADPLAEGLKRTINWIGFHVTLVVAALLTLWRETDRVRLLGWAALSFASVTTGRRFFPRYYFQLLPVAALLAGRGLVQARGPLRLACLLLLLVPLVRFGPRYLALAADALAGRPPSWSDVALHLDSRRAGEQIRALARPGDTLLVWGYRPDIFLAAGLPAGTRFLDSQPLTGVLADRHLTDATAFAPTHRDELLRTRPTFIADGLGPINPALAVTNYPDLAGWLRQYRVVGRTTSTILYRRTDTL